MRNLQLTAIDLVSLREQILGTEACTLDSLSDPSRWTSLPFPALSPQLPLDRFRFNPDGTFRFMGRQIFADVYQAVSNLSWRTGTNYSLQGSLGSGKSHILAALACLLVKEGRRVVYLPDAKRLAAAMVAYTKFALQLTYADDRELFQRIQGFKSTETICEFVQERQVCGEELYFICGPMNTLDHYLVTGNKLGPQDQDDVLTFILQLSGFHKLIWSGSGNCQVISGQSSGVKRLLVQQGYNRVWPYRFVGII